MKKNEIGLQGIKALEDCLTLSKTIKELNLSGNNFGDEGVAIVIRALSNKKKHSLQVLGLSNNFLTSEGCKLICQYIATCSSLQEIQLSNNEIDNDGAQKLIQVLKNRKKFNNIDIDNNKISGETLSDLFNILPLRNLNLIKNVLTDLQVEPVAKTLKANQNIQQIFMSHNQMS